MYNTLKELLRPRTIFATLFYSSFCYLVVVHKEVPDDLENIVLMILSYYFGSKVRKVENEK